MAVQRLSRQLLGAAVRWGYMTKNPAVLAGKNPQPDPRAIRVFSYEELEAIAAELSPEYRPLPMFAASTGLRPEEWQVLERKDIDRKGRVLNVRRTISCGEVVELGKTSRSRRQVPLSAGALEALDMVVSIPLLFTAPKGGVINLDNFRRREWVPAIEAAGIEGPARIYDLRCTFASNSLAAGIQPFEVAKVMGTSMEMLERHYGSLLQGSAASIADRLGAFERLGRDWVAESDR